MVQSKKRSSRIRHRNVLAMKAWEKVVQQLAGKGGTRALHAKTASGKERVQIKAAEHEFLRHSLGKRKRKETKQGNK